MPMAEEFTTAEALLLETIVAHKLLGAEASTFPTRIWVKPQLEALEYRGLVTWSYDSNGNFTASALPAAIPKTSAGELRGTAV